MSNLITNCHTFLFPLVLRICRTSRPSFKILQNQSIFLNLLAAMKMSEVFFFYAYSVHLNMKIRFK